MPCRTLQRPNARKIKVFFPWTSLRGSRGQRYPPAQRGISNSCSQTRADQLHVVTQIRSLQRELAAAAKTAAGHPPLEALPARALTQCLSWGFGIRWSPPDEWQPGPCQVSPRFSWGPAISSQFKVLLSSSSGSPAANWLVLGCTELTPTTKSRGPWEPTPASPPAFPRALGLPSGSRILQRPRCPLPPPLPCPLAAPRLRLCSRGRAGSKQLDIYSPHLPLLAQRHFPAALLPSLHTPDAKSAPSEQLSTALLQKRDRETCGQAAPQGWPATTGANKPQNCLHPSLQSLLTGSSSTGTDGRAATHAGTKVAPAPALPSCLPQLPSSAGLLLPASGIMSLWG